MPPRRTAALASAALALAALALAACSGTPPEDSRTPGTPTATATPTPTATAGDRAACASLYARLQRVTAAIGSASELVAGSTDAQDLSGRIAVEQGQLERAADLMATPPVPAAVADADRQLVAALRAFAADFGRAREPAARGDFAGATRAMSDPAVVQRILDAAQAVENACKP